MNIWPEPRIIICIGPNRLMGIGCGDPPMYSVDRNGQFVSVPYEALTEDEVAAVALHRMGFIEGGTLR